MKKFERKVKEQAKKEVADFESWYIRNTIKIANAQTYTQQAWTKSVRKTGFDWVGLLLAVVLSCSMVFLVLSVLYMPKSVESPIEDVHVQLPPDMEEAVDDESLFYEKLVEEYYRLVVGGMGLDIAFESIETFATDVVEGRFVLTAIKGEIKTSIDNYLVSFYFPPTEDYDFANKQDYDNLLTEYDELDGYEIVFNKHLLSGDIYDYKMKITYTNGNVCYLNMQCAKNDFEDFINTVFVGGSKSSIWQLVFDNL